jgi:hypothetical protein
VLSNYHLSEVIYLPEKVDEDVSEAVANSTRRQGDYPSRSRKSLRFFPEKTSLHYFE